MDIEKSLLKEHSRRQADSVVKYIGSRPSRFADLMKIFFGGEYRTKQRAAWAMSICIQHHPELIRPYLKKMVDLLKLPSTPVALTRNSLRALQFINIPGRYQGDIMDICFKVISDPQQPPANKAFSLTVLHNLSKKYPEIIHEMKIIIEENWERESPAFRARAKRVIKP